MKFRRLADDQRCLVYVGRPDTAAPALLLETTEILLEAPNWSADGNTLYLNGDGKLWALDARSAKLAPVEFDGLPGINNDHVLDPAGVHIYLSAMDGHIYRGALTGGKVEKITPEDGKWHFLHGVSPDGTRLAYVEIDDFANPGRLAVIAAAGGDRTLIDTGRGHIDGPEWSPDGAWLYYNTESFTSAPGHAQLARIPVGGGNPDRLVTSATVDWFPHLSPDGRLATYISFPAGTLGHPADLPVEVKVVATDDWAAPLQRYPVLGGQGTINVNSWAPDSSRFAFVAYPMS